LLIAMGLVALFCSQMSLSSTISRILRKLYYEMLEADLCLRIIRSPSKNVYDIELNWAVSCYRIRAIIERKL